LVFEIDLIGLQLFEISASTPLLSCFLLERFPISTHSAVDFSWKMLRRSTSLIPFALVG
jgi:hypothetical protein